MELNIANLGLQHHAAVREILSALGHEISPSGIPFSAKVCEKGFSVERKNGGLTVSYSRKCELFRSLSFLKSVGKKEGNHDHCQHLCGVLRQ